MAHNAVGRVFRSRSGLQQPSTLFRQIRNNSTSASKGIPSFGPVSTPELEKQLKYIREQLFVPMYMTERQRRLMFRPRYRERLVEEQVKVTIGEEEFTLYPRIRQQLPSKETVFSTMEGMKTPKDWENLIPLLIGLRKSNIAVHPASYEKWVRLAGKSGATAVILELAKQTKRTGFTLSSYGVGLQLALSLYERAQAAGFKGEAVSTALRHAEQAAQVMNTPEHTNSEPLQDPKRQPWFIGVCLQLSAAQALEQQGGEDAAAKAASYARKLMGNWELVKTESASEKWGHRDELLQETVLIRGGLATALQVNSVSSDKNLRKQIQQRLKTLDDVISEQMKHLPSKFQENPTRGASFARALRAE
ncbi:hypothetical protein PISL3812_04313 [Talaromyces islandicus]|uniref:Uncharacterized protein n=1 Tax=Talaromyces islandicus TaxID=28573 RepID=A0A0U1LWY5_TALIS|nr:hypothetical protein PISL3812_04313 [Talaromyces islandicus]